MAHIYKKKMTNLDYNKRRLKNLEEVEEIMGTPLLSKKEKKALLLEKRIERIVVKKAKKTKELKEKILKYKYVASKIKSKNKNYIHTLLNRIFYDTFQHYLFLSAYDIKYAPTIYNRDYFKRFKDKFLSFLKPFIVRYNLDKDLKAERFQDRTIPFGVHPLVTYKNYNKLITYLLSNNEKYLNNKSTKHLFYILEQTVPLLKSYYRNIQNIEPYNYKEPYVFKWGVFTSDSYNYIKHGKLAAINRYNYLYYNLAIYRYITFKSYLNKLTSYLKVKTTNYKLNYYTIRIIKYFLNQLYHNTFVLDSYIAKYKKQLNEHLISKSKTLKRKDKLLIERFKLDNMKHYYMRLLKTLYLRYFKVNIHLKFTKTNIFITVTDFRGNVKYRHSIGLLGYKKDKKKTYYAAKELIKECFPDFFKYFEIRKESILTAISYVHTDLIEFHLGKLDRNPYDWAKSWDPRTDDKYTLQKAFATILGSSLDKFLNISIILRGSKSKLKGLLRRIFKLLKIYRIKNKTNKLMNILFISLNTKPHNGCRSPKKGRRKTKRRKQKLKYKILNRQIEFSKKYLSGLFYWRRRMAKAYQIKLEGSNLKKNIAYRSSKYKNKFLQNKYANIATNICSSRTYQFLYAGKPRTRKPKLFEKLGGYKESKYNRSYRIWRDQERWVNPFAVLPSMMPLNIKKKKINRNPRYYYLNRSNKRSV